MMRSRRSQVWDCPAVPIRTERVRCGAGAASLVGGRTLAVGAGDSTHPYGTAADLDVPGVAAKTVHQKAGTCGFSGPERYAVDHQHAGGRADLGRDRWWESGTV
ncbi:hypothetical protein [Streptomyces sp. NPDC058751]|uniref:hypothetical protein n=1 Tax=Streptomyces sp. NPDC058751 TaxID=3346623 RepID=UPI0036AC4E42